MGLLAVLPEFQRITASECSDAGTPRFVILSLPRAAVGRERRMRPVPATIKRSEDGMSVTQEEIMAALKECYDPEIPVNIVDMGLVYEVRVKPAAVANTQGEEVEVEMTLTAPGCPSSGYITDQVKQRLLRVPGVSDAKVEIVWYPQWTPERLSADARKQLGIE